MRRVAGYYDGKPYSGKIIASWPAAPGDAKQILVQTDDGRLIRTFDDSVKIEDSDD